MPSKRTYGDVCGVARALDLVGERWTLMVVRELLLGPKRFTDLRAGLPHVGPDVLTQRLKDMDAAGLVRRRTLPPPAAAKVYELTTLGCSSASPTGAARSTRPCASARCGSPATSRPRRDSRPSPHRPGPPRPR